jgi:hypothetical protein
MSIGTSLDMNIISKIKKVNLLFRSLVSMNKDQMKKVIKLKRKI